MIGRFDALRFAVWVVGPIALWLAVLYAGELVATAMEKNMFGLLDVLGAAVVLLYGYVAVRIVMREVRRGKAHLAALGIGLTWPATIWNKIEKLY